ncbi:toll/interleukin-1 receptor domain-containing protein [Ulvibacter antarcticus]|uniref:TIR domain-containing protein n=1 Tax=Ulvibacter antarcticus TaxID=442714 RepID=A0A3L9YHG4_9FLAO|nr:toll/interleukin-1 receptor domain-containing protein [Ulvibacter antarcticus]RMA58900.1 TIR domain-containing protein [Ulvibacter antarcticus]
MKKKLITTFSIGFIILFITMILQTIIGNKYPDGKIIAWLWLLVLYIPLLYLTFQIKSKYKIKVNGLMLLSVLYVCATLLVILLQPMALKEGNMSFLDTLKISLLFLLPLAIFLGIIIWKKILQKQPKSATDDVIPENPIVFISYNHGDSDVAIKIHDALEAANIEVIIDREEMKAGADIKEFIQNCVKESNVTLSLVSNKSLRSAWVAMETTNTFFLEAYTPQKKFIACFLDDDFFQSDFTLKAIDDIDKQIKENQALIPKYHEKMLDTRDLNNQNTRLLSLRNNLDEIIRRLRESLCLDVREDKFEASMKQLIATLNAEE